MKIIKKYLGYVIASLIALSALVVMLFFDLKEGWSNQKTIKYLFSLTIFISGISFYKPFLDYLLSNQKDCVISSNELFRIMEKAEKLDLLSKYESSLILKETDLIVQKINNYLSINCSLSISVSHDSIKQFFNKNNKKGIYYLQLSEDDLITLIKYYNDYCDSKSLEYEKLFRRYKNQSLIATKEFPVFSFVLPTLATIIGVFTTVYQSIDSTDLEPLISYLSTYFFVMLFGAIYTFSYCQNVAESQTKRNYEIVNDIKSIISSNQ